VNPPVVLAIQITPASLTIPKGTTQQFTATGTLSDGSTKDISGQVTWSSDTPAFATISATGLATGVAMGPTTLTATFNGVSAHQQLTIGAPVLVTIAVAPTDPSIVAGTTLQFMATGTLSDATTEDLTIHASWTSDTTNVASISPTGLASAAAMGTAIITAQVGDVSGMTVLMVNPAASNPGSSSSSGSGSGQGSSGNNGSSGGSSSSNGQSLSQQPAQPAQPTNPLFVAKGLSIHAAHGKPAKATVVDFSEPGAKATGFTVLIDWGDGSAPTAGHVKSMSKGNNNSKFSATGSHRYGQVGTFATTITVMDAAGVKVIAHGSAHVK
jgi:hypothetical protein